MFDSLKEWFAKAWIWIQALWDKHDDALAEMVQAILPMVIAVTFRPDLSGEQKRKAVIDAVLDGAQGVVGEISLSMLNEAVEIAVNKYNIQIGKLTIDQIDAAREAALTAGRKYADGILDITGTEAEDALIKLEPQPELPTEPATPTV